MRSPYTFLATAGATAVVGVLLVFALPSDPLTIDLPDSGSGYLYVQITTQRALGIGLIYLGSLFGSRVLGRWIATRYSIPATRVILIIGAVVALVGFYLVWCSDALNVGNLGSFSFDENGGDRQMPFLLFLTAWRAVGFALVWIASALVVGSLGRTQRRHNT